MASITIDLTEYGMQGTVEMGEPSQRNIAMMNNALGNCTVTKMVNGEPVVVETRIGDAEMIQTLVYVRHAPFKNTVSAFLDFCDRMPEGMDTRLFARMKEIGESIKEGNNSPFADSQGAETQISV